MSLHDIARQERRRRTTGEPPLTVSTRPPSFAERTGQARRLWVARWLVMFGGVTMTLGAYKARAASADTWLFVLLAGVGICVVGIIAQCLSIRCPRCHVAVVWHTYTHAKAGAAEKLASFQVACPNCGYEPANAGDGERM